MSSGQSNRGTWQQFAVEKEGVEDEVLNLFKQGKSLTDISAHLKTKKIDIAPTAIGRWLQKTRTEFQESTSIDRKEKFETMILNYRGELNEILEEVKEMKNKVRDDGDIKSYEKLIGRLYQGLELLAKLTGDFKETKTIDINILINEINQRTFEEKKDVRNKMYSPTIIDVEAEILEEDKKAEAALRGQK